MTSTAFCAQVRSPEVTCLPNEGEKGSEEIGATQTLRSSVELVPFHKDSISPGNFGSRQLVGGKFALQAGILIGKNACEAGIGVSDDSEG